MESGAGPTGRGGANEGPSVHAGALTTLAKGAGDPTSRLVAPEAVPASACATADTCVGDPGCDVFTASDSCQQVAVQREALAEAHRQGVGEGARLHSKRVDALTRAAYADGRGSGHPYTDADVEALASVLSDTFLERSLDCWPDFEREARAALDHLATRFFAEGRRQAIEGWDREWSLNGSAFTGLSGDEARIRGLAAANPELTVVSRLVGKWEPAEQSEQAGAPDLAAEDRCARSGCGHPRKWHNARTTLGVYPCVGDVASCACTEFAEQAGDPQ